MAVPSCEPERRARRRRRHTTARAWPRPSRLFRRISTDRRRVAPVVRRRQTSSPAHATGDHAAVRLVATTPSAADASSVARPRRDPGKDPRAPHRSSPLVFRAAVARRASVAASRPPRAGRRQRRASSLDGRGARSASPCDCRDGVAPCDADRVDAPGEQGPSSLQAGVDAAQQRRVRGATLYSRRRYERP